MSRMSYMRQLYRFIRRDLLLCHIASCDVIWCHSMSCDVFKLDITSVATNSAKSPSQRAVVSYYITWRHMISHDNIWCSMMLIPCYGRLVPHKVTISSFTCHMTSYDVSTCHVMLYDTYIELPSPKSQECRYLSLNSSHDVIWCHMMSYAVIWYQVMLCMFMWAHDDNIQVNPIIWHHMTSHNVI